MPNYVTGTTEIQFMAYLQLIRNRLKLLNTILVEFRPLKRNRTVNEYFPKIQMSQHSQIDPQRFLDGIGAYALKGKSKLQSIPNVPPATETRTTKSVQHFACNAIDWMIKLLLKRKISINEFRGSASNLFSDLENVGKIHDTYSKLENAAILINAAYSVQLTVILIIKFTILTSRLYFCCMMIIKSGAFYST